MGFTDNSVVASFFWGYPVLSKTSESLAADQPDARQRRRSAAAEAQRLRCRTHSYASLGGVVILLFLADAYSLNRHLILKE